MATRYDAVIVGAGHNGLVAAAYLATAGRRVLVVERRDVAGGIASTIEFAPGFKASVGPDLCGLLLPQVVSDLRLADHGLDLLPLDPTVTTLDPDGAHLWLWRDESRTLDAIKTRSPRDAQRYRDFATLVQRIAAFLRPRMSQPAVQPEVERAGDLIELLRLGVAFRRIGSEAMHETMRTLPMAIADFLNEWFEDDVLKATLAMQGLQGVSLGPRSAGSAAVFLYHQLGQPAWPRAGWALPRGGAGGLAGALVEAVDARGGEIRLNALVSKILVKDGRAAGVVLENGDEIEADTIVSNASPRTTFLELLEPGVLAPEFVREVMNIRYRGVTAKLLLALDRAPSFTTLGDTGAGGVAQIGSTLDYLERAYDAVKYGRVSEAPVLEIVVPSLTDPTVAPDAHHVMSVTAQYAPYHLREGDWSEHGHALAATILRQLETFWPDVREAILHQRMITPLDYETTYGLPEGSLHHGELALDQLYFMRPVPGWSRYRTPIDGLFLCGAGTHPGGGFSGACGYNAARAILR